MGAKEIGGRLFFDPGTLRHEGGLSVEGGKVSIEVLSDAIHEGGLVMCHDGEGDRLPLTLYKPILECGAADVKSAGNGGDLLTREDAGEGCSFELEGVSPARGHRGDPRLLY